MLKRITAALAAAILAAVIAAPVHADSSDGPPNGITVLDGTMQTGDENDDGPAYYPTEIGTVTEGKNTLIVKKFEVPTGTSPQELVEKDLQQDGMRYAVRHISKKELEPIGESRMASKTVTLDVDTDDKKEILSKLSPFIDYNEGGYTGQLKLDENSLEAEVTESEGYSYLIKDTRQFYGLNRNDAYYVPHTITKNGATLQLANIEWSPMGERYDVNSVPRLYNAAATYSGKAYGSKATAYEAKVTYSGEVTRLMPGNHLYTLIYEPVGAMPLTAEEQEALKEKGTWIVLAWIGGGLLLVAVIGGGVFALLKFGVLRRPKNQPKKPPKPPRRPPENDGDDEFDDYETASADTEMPDRRTMRVPEAMRQMERPDTGGNTYG